MTNREKTIQLYAERAEYISQQRKLAESLSDNEFLMVTRAMSEGVEEYNRKIYNLEMLPFEKLDEEYTPSEFESMFY